MNHARTSWHRRSSRTKSNSPKPHEHSISDELDHLYADDMVMTSVLGETCRKAAVMDEARRGAAMRTQAADGGNAGYDDIRQGRLDGRSARRRSHQQLPIRRRHSRRRYRRPSSISDDERLGEKRRTLAGGCRAYRVRSRPQAGRQTGRRAGLTRELAVASCRWHPGTASPA